MLDCPICGGDTCNLNHRLENIIWSFKEGKLEIKKEVWRCIRQGGRYDGELCDEASGEVNRDYEIRKRLFWNLEMQEIRRASGLAVDLEILVNVAGCYVELENYKLALSCLGKMLEMDPNNLECNYQKGLIYIKQGKPDLARLEFIRAARNGHKESQDALNEL